MRCALLVLALAGCSSRHAWDAPWPREPVAPARAPDSDVATEIREGRLAVDLPTVLRLAGANSLDVAFVREKVHEAYAQASLAEERFWPAVVPGFMLRRHERLTQATDGTFVDVDKQQQFYGLWAGARWEVGEAIFATLSASQRYEGSRFRLEAAEQDVQLEAALAYFDLVRETLRARVSEQSAGVSEKLSSELDASVQAGRGFRGDVLRARVQSAGSRLQVLRAREATRLASLRLGSILRLAPGIELYPSEEVPPPLALVRSTMTDPDLLREALGRRPEIREAMAELVANRHDRTAAKWGPLIPSLQLDAASGGLGPVPSRLEGTRDYALTVGWKIGPGGLLDSGRRDLADARERQAEIHLERIRQRVTDQVLAAATQIRAKEEQRKLTEQAVRDAEEALSLNQQRQAQNIGLPLEVLQSEEALTRARLDLYTVIVEFNQGQMRAFVAAGRKGVPEK